MSTGIEALAAVTGSKEVIVGDISQLQTANSVAGTSFANLIDSGIGQVNESLKASESVLHAMSLDKNVSAHEVMLVMEKAKMELKLMVEVRNKLLESYQEIMRMQV